MSLAKKYDQDKPRLDLIDTTFLYGLGDVLTFGANKYDAHNWRKGLPLSRLTAACMRHIGKFNDNETFDEESGLNHLYHAAACLMMASWVLKNKPELDDRWKEENATTTI